MPAELAVSIRLAVDCSPICLGCCLQRLELQLLAAKRTLAAATEQHEVAQVGSVAGNVADLRYSGTDVLTSMILMCSCSLSCSCPVQCSTHPWPSSFVHFIDTLLVPQRNRHDAAHVPHDRQECHALA